MIVIYSGGGASVEAARDERADAGTQHRFALDYQTRIVPLHKEMQVMLVLSRKPQETIVFPNLGITLEIVRIAGGKVRVGIEAPSQVEVLRGEIANRSTELCAEDTQSNERPKSWKHHLRNRLHTAGLGLKLLEKQLAAGMLDEAEETLAKALGVFKQLDGELEQARSSEDRTLGRRALVVEDDTNESQLLAGILRMSGYMVDTAADGLEALSLLKKNARPDFVLLDMNMPRCDGPTTLAAIRANPEWHNLRVFAVSGSSQREVGVSVGEVGVNRWFQKPLDPEVLLGVMNDLHKPACSPI